jgi:excisionase family DNA binding protein
MSDLLTTKQVRELLQVDRTTIYRMLKDGRLLGIKLGHQWRFSARQIENLLNGVAFTLEEEPAPIAPENLPISCFQSMQDVFADITEIGAVTTRPDGAPLTQISINCEFCRMLLNSKTGRQACLASWRELADYQPEQKPFAVCHAGLQYMPAPVKSNGVIDALLIAGQFYSCPPDAAEEAVRIQKLSRKHHLDEAALAAAARDIPILDTRQKGKISGWLTRIAALFEHVSCERVSFMDRLQRIANMSDLAHDPIRTAAPSSGQI